AGNPNIVPPPSIRSVWADPGRGRNRPAEVRGMSHGTFRVRRAIPRRYYHRMASSVSRSMESPFIRKVAVCLAVFLVVSTLSRIPIWPVTRLTGLLRWAFTTDSDLGPVIAALKRAAAVVSTQ
ncbi:MAG: hypothetical protein ACM3WT_08035, partial [Bacillota bacterium]